MAVTDPYVGDIAARLSKSIRHGCRVLAVPVMGDPVELDLDKDALKVTFSEAWAPHIQADITIKAPAAAAALAVLDPRGRCHIVVEAGYVHAGEHEDIHLLADLALRTRSTRRPDNTLVMTAASGEAYALDRRRATATALPTFAGTVEALTWFITLAAYPAAPVIVSDFPAAYRKDAVAGMESEVGADLWGYIEDIAARAGVWVYVNDAGAWRITTRPALGGTPAMTLETGQRATLYTTETALDREGWANEVILAYKWKDAAGAEKVIYGQARVKAGPLGVDTAGYKTAIETLTRYATQAQANAAASARLSNLVTRGRGFVLSAPAAYWLRPGMTITVQLPTGDPEAHIIKEITFYPLTGLMELTTRQPENVIIETGE